MYTKFKECLLKPNCISKYVNDKKSRHILYFLLLVLLYILPTITPMISSKSVDSTKMEQLVSDIAKADLIEYELKYNDNGNLILSSKSAVSKPAYAILENAVNEVDIVLLFNETALPLKEYHLSNQLVGASALYVQFTKENVHIFSTVYQGANNIVNNNIQEVSTLRFETKELIKTYDELNFTPIDFTKVKENKVRFSIALDKLLSTSYKKFKAIALLVMIPFTYIQGILLFLLEAMMFAFFIRILNLRSLVPFKKLLTIVILTYTPRVVFNIVSLVWSSSLIYFIGEIISIIYLFIAMNNYQMEQIMNDK